MFSCSMNMNISQQIDSAPATKSIYCYLQAANAQKYQTARIWGYHFWQNDMVAAGDVDSLTQDLKRYRAVAKRISSAHNVPASDVKHHSGRCFLRIWVPLVHNVQYLCQFRTNSSDCLQTTHRFWHFAAKLCKDILWCLNNLLGFGVAK